MAQAKRGRPSAFNETMANKILAMAEKGASEVQICARLGIPLRTFTNWKNRHEDFWRALRDSKSIADEIVEATMFRLAVGGYKLPKLKVVYDQERGEFKTHAYREVLAPDLGACSLWMRNRRPAEWRANPPEVPEELPEGEAGDMRLLIEIIDEDGKPRAMTIAEVQAMGSYYDRKPPPLKVVGPVVED